MNNLPEYTEADWKLFRKKISDWQERYMKALIQEYVELLSDESKHASDRFWELEERIRADKQDTGVICEMRRSQLVYNMISLAREGAITQEDLDGFSEGLVERVSRCLGSLSCF
ncbi:MAG: multidrug transporter [Eubacteriales bacterium]|nr:multidrug transporter [Eubacteriales bacterium]